jgi:hypothetical protein
MQDMATFQLIVMILKLDSSEMSPYLAFTNELNVAQKEKNIDE